MSLGIPLFLSLIGVASLWRGRRRAGLALFLFSAALIGVFGNGPFADWSLAELQSNPYVTNPEWRNKNLVVVLGAGTIRRGEWISLPVWAYSRLTETARLYRDCKSDLKRECKVLASGGDPRGNGKSEAAVMADWLEILGVTAGDLIREDKSRNTFQNARFSSPTILDGGYDKVYLVTSGFHMRRALLDFAYFQITATPAPSDFLTPIWAPVPVTMNFALSDIALHEFGGVLQFYFYNWMGWNPPRGTR